MKIFGFFVLVLLVNLVVMWIFYRLNISPTTTSDSDDVISPPPPSDSILGVFSQAAIVAQGAPCAAIGKRMLLAGGNAVDAAIATLLCDGVCVMQSNGIGGGFIMTLYNKTERKTYSIIARETAPNLATQDMYTNHSERSRLCALAAGVPGELKGYQSLHQKYGKLQWSELFQPTITLCKEGVQVSKRMAKNFLSEASHIRNSSTFIRVILNSTGGQLPKEGDKIKLPLLAQTLSVIANSAKRADELYSGSLTKQFVKDIQDAGGIITEQDMNDYRVQWKEPYNASLSGDLTLLSAALPGSGILVAFMMRVLDGFLQFASSDIQRSQLIVETFKHAYGRRTNLGDPDYVNATLIDEVVRNLTEEAAILGVREKIISNWTTNDVSYYGAHYLKDDHGTNHVVVVDQEGNAISVTSTRLGSDTVTDLDSLNLEPCLSAEIQKKVDDEKVLNEQITSFRHQRHLDYKRNIVIRFGSKFVSRSTGIILNNQMDDFSTPGTVNYFGVSPSVANFIAPGKRPLSSMSPTIVVDNLGDVRLVVGAAGGTMITIQVTLATIRNLWLGKNVKEVLDEPRFHHQLLPMNITYEYGILKEMVDSWRNIGHSVRRLTSDNFLGALTAIARVADNITASWDWRRPGSLVGI